MASTSSWQHNYAVFITTSIPRRSCWLDCLCPQMPSLALEPDWSITNTLGFPDFCHQAILAQPKNLAYPKAVAQFLAQYQDAGIAALALTPNLETAQDFINQHYVGCYQSLADYALQYCGITDQDSPSPDFSRFGQDHREGENTFIHSGQNGVHIFVTT